MTAPAARTGRRPKAARDKTGGSAAKASAGPAKAPAAPRSRAGTAGAKQAPPERRRQQDRSAATRARLLEAAIHSLFTRGYAATTTMIVAEDAGVSRGAMLHQFPTRVDLMLYVYRGVYEADMQAYAEEMAKPYDARQRLRAFIALAWERLSNPAGIAVLELMLGARSDPAFAAQLAPLKEQIEQESFRQASVWVQSANIGRTDLQRLAAWAMRGLALARMLSNDPAEIEQSYALLERMLINEVEFEPQATAGPAGRAPRKRGGKPAAS